MFLKIISKLYNTPMVSVKKYYRFLLHFAQYLIKLLFFFPDCSFPYIIIIISMMTSASHFSIEVDQTAPALLMSSITNPRNLVILIGHWLVHAYGIISLTGLKDLWYLGLVPAPALFYMLTAQFTDPMKIHND